jgi:hypothetical protein
MYDFLGEDDPASQDTPPPNSNTRIYGYDPFADENSLAFNLEDLEDGEITTLIQQAEVELANRKKNQMTQLPTAVLDKLVNAMRRYVGNRKTSNLGLEKISVYERLQLEALEAFDASDKEGRVTIVPRKKT